MKSEDHELATNTCGDLFKLLGLHLPLHSLRDSPWRALTRTQRLALLKTLLHEGDPAPTAEELLKSLGQNGRELLEQLLEDGLLSTEDAREALGDAPPPEEEAAAAAAEGEEEPDGEAEATAVVEEEETETAVDGEAEAAGVAAGECEDEQQHVQPPSAEEAPAEDVAAEEGEAPAETAADTALAVEFDEGEGDQHAETQLGAEITAAGDVASTADAAVAALEEAA